MKKEVYIVGGGSSLKRFDMSTLRDKDTICVNSSVLDVPKPNYFITMDQSLLKKVDLSDIPYGCEKVFVLNRVPKYIEKVNNKWTDTRSNFVYDLDFFDTIYQSNHCDGDISSDYKLFNSGSHSGYCALQLALIRGYSKFYLLGFDYKQYDGTHYHDRYKNNTHFLKNMELFKFNFKKAVCHLRGYYNIEVNYL